MNPDLKEQLRQLGLHYTAGILDDVVALATKNRWGAHQLFEHVARVEAEDRARRSLERRLGRSRIGRLKAIADFVWAWPKRIDRDAVESALNLDFVAKAHNIVLVAPQGLGKTMIAQNIAHLAIQAGHSVLFTTAASSLGARVKQAATQANPQTAYRRIPSERRREPRGRRLLRWVAPRAMPRRLRKQARLGRSTARECRSDRSSPTSETSNVRVRHLFQRR